MNGAIPSDHINKNFSIKQTCQVIHFLYANRCPQVDIPVNKYCLLTHTDTQYFQKRKTYVKAPVINIVFYCIISQYIEQHQRKLQYVRAISSETCLSNNKQTIDGGLRVVTTCR